MSDPIGNPPSPLGKNRAVFLSYASEDAGVVSRIGDTLRTADVEVWFDRNELTGGDAWDAKIRKQIKECALFVPVISAHTQARLEGYFRLEWKLAAQRTHTMADAKPFLLPVVIDATREAEAHVPEEFRALQWTRLPAGEMTAKFTERVIRLVDPQSPETSPSSGRSVPATPIAPPPTWRQAWWMPAILLILVILLAAAGWFFIQKPAAATAQEKTLAVLPFTTSGGDKDNETLSDGIADELLTQLGRAPGVRVSGRTSSFSFRGKNLTDAEIARKLDVQYLVTGTFQKDGKQVRIRASLINAADGLSLWSDSFTKELTNVFALQDEIAGLIAQKLQLNLRTNSRATKTIDPVAYGLVQKGRYLWLQRTDAALAESIAAYEEAIRMAPDYAEAHAGLADAALIRGWYTELEGVKKAGEHYFIQARNAAMRALELDASLAGPHATLGAVNYNEGNRQESEREFQAALRLNPNYSYTHNWRSHLLLIEGRIDEALDEIERATQIDPFSLANLVIYNTVLVHAGRYSEAIPIADRAVAVRQGDYLPVDGVQALSLLGVGRRDEAVSAARKVTRNLAGKPRWWMDSLAIYVLKMTGHEEEAESHARQVLGSAPENSYLRIQVAAAAGRTDDALDALRRIPVSATALTMLYYSEVCAEMRQSPRFPTVMNELGWWDAYERGQQTLARMKKEPAGKN